MVPTFKTLQPNEEKKIMSNMFPTVVLWKFIRGEYFRLVKMDRFLSYFLRFLRK